MTNSNSRNIFSALALLALVAVLSVGCHSVGPNPNTPLDIVLAVLPNGDVARANGPLLNGSSTLMTLAGSSDTVEISSSSKGDILVWKKSGGQVQTESGVLRIIRESSGHTIHLFDPFTYGDMRPWWERLRMANAYIYQKQLWR